MTPEYEVIFFLGKPGRVDFTSMPSEIRALKVPDASFAQMRLRHSQRVLAIILDLDTALQVNQARENPGTNSTACGRILIRDLHRTAPQVKIIGITALETFHETLTQAGCDIVCLTPMLPQVIRSLIAEAA